MTYATDPSRGDFEYPDEAGYLDGVGTLTQDQAVLIEEVTEDEHAPALSFFVVNDDKTRPIVWAFIERNPEYADLVDSKLPGVPKGLHRS